MRYVLRFILFLLFFSLVIRPSYPLAQVSNDLKRPLILSLFLEDRTGTDSWHEGLVSNSQSAADALDMDIEHMFVGTIRPVILKMVEERLKSEPIPDYVIFGNQRGLGGELLGLTNAHDVKSFLYIAPLSNEDYAYLGGPRGQYKNWIGQLIPNDEQVGYDLANYLIENARQKKTQSGDRTPVTILAINGRNSNTASINRHKGFMRAIQEHDDIIHHQSVSGRWHGYVAGEKYRFLKMRYGKMDVVWAANDPMALGVLEVSKTDKTLPSVGGVDWIAPAIDAVKNKELVVTMGGHNFDIAYVVYLLRQDFDGKDFSKITGTTTLNSKLVPITQANYRQYDKIFALLSEGKINYRDVFDKAMADPKALEDISFLRFKNAAMASFNEGDAS